MKLLYISEFFPSTAKLDVHGGMEMRTYYMATLLGKTQSVTVISSHEKGKPPYQKLQNVSVFRVGPSRSYSRQGNVLSRLGFMISTIRLGLSLEFDLVEGDGFFAWLPTWVLKTIKRKKGIIIIADIIEAYSAEINPLLMKVLQLYEGIMFLVHWNAVIAISNTVKQKLIKKGMRAADIQVIYCGVDMEKIRKTPAKKIRNNSIVCVSRLVPYKKIDVLIKAIKKVSQKIPNISLDVVGDGECRNQLKQLTINFQLQDKITFHAFVRSHAQVIRLLKQSAIFCLPSTVEGFGIATVEAFACKKPTILVDTLISREITNGQGALFFSADDAKDLAQKILKLSGDRKLYQKLQRESIQVAKNYDWKQITKKTYALYANLCTN